MTQRTSLNRVFAPALVVIVAGAFAFAEPAKDAPKADSKAAQPEIKLPPGWTMEDMQKCVAASTPGKMQEHLAKGAGVWQGKSTMWMAPGAEPVRSEMMTTVTPILDGRYVKVEVKGEMPGMGPFSGGGVYGYDNVAKKFVASWIDSQSTGIMNGTGELSADGKVMTWTYTYTCPITEKPTAMREVHTTTGPDTETLEMFGADPKSGKEFKMMRIEMTRKKDAAAKG